MNKISVCYLSFNYYPGQGIVAFFEFPRKMKEIGHDVYVIAAARNDEKSFEVVDGVNVIRIQVKTTKKRSLDNFRFSILASRVLSKIIENNKINIVHIFSYAFAFLIKFQTFPSSKKVKWIYDIRSGPLLENIFYKLGKKLIQFSTSFFDKTFIIDEMVNNEILGNQINEETVVIPSGVDLQNFKPANNRLLLMKYEILENNIVLIYIGNLNYERRLSNLILAFWKASKKIEDLRLMIIGDGNSILDLKLLTKKLLLSDKIFFLGYIDYSTIPFLLSAADIAISYIPIVPAFNSQPPTKTVEYLACSLPVIATATQGNIRFIEHEKNGLLTGDDPNSVSKEIIRLSLDVNLRQILTENARSSIIKYDWRTIVTEKLLPAYGDVLGD